MAPLTTLVLVLAMAVFQPSMILSGDAGINYGRNGDNLPSPKQVINFLTKDLNYRISLIRIYDANLDILEALSGTNLVVTIGVPNEAISYVASSQEAADKWVQDHIITYIRKGVRFRYLCVGNEAIPGVVASDVLQAILNLQNSLRQRAGTQDIYVTTAVSANVLGVSFPPSQGQFAPNVADIMSNITLYLHRIGSPLLINVYPYFALVSEPGRISLDYALFQAPRPIKDGELEYYNLFDAMVDAFVAALVRVVQSEDVKLVVSETGWPTAGREPYSSIENARIYNNKLREHAITRGTTPRKADINLEVYIFSMFNENFKQAGEQQNFGTFYPNLTQVYPLWY
ncbi:glucan endo-1,3-beta-glucosidase-like [Pistacia vera]|uniref:glucan endo-1,3-beta-glucosidase-like n=1 Tax=Pistacia vera TaxID=55513 RepID=UPI001263A097|nr:glucan endo-1,3-beta-glucosidase-like [Pistacia vera]